MHIGQIKADVGEEAEQAMVEGAPWYSSLTQHSFATPPDSVSQEGIGHDSICH